jgi:hypothetical protein
MSPQLSASAASAFAAVEAEVRRLRKVGPRGVYSEIE